MPTRNSQQGFTLTEVMISMLIFSSALAGLFGFMDTSLSSSALTMTLSRLNQDGARALDEILDELIRAEEASMAPVSAPLSTSSITYRHPAGVAAGAVVWGGQRILEFQYDPADPDDGIDNNGNGLIDEGRVVLRTDVGTANEAALVIVTGVSELLQGEVQDAVDNNANGLENERGFCMDFDTGTETWNVRLTLLRQNMRGQWFSRTFVTGVSPRN